MDNKNAYEEAFVNAAGMGRLETVMSIVEMGVKIGCLNNKALKEAIWYDKKHIVEYILINNDTQSSQILFWVLKYACQHAYPDLIEMVLTVDKEIVNIKSCRLQMPNEFYLPIETLLHSSRYVCGFSKIEKSLDVLIKFGAKRSNLSLKAVIASKSDLFEKVFKMDGEEIDISVLTEAVKRSDVKAIEALVKKGGVNINASDWNNDYLTPIDYFIKKVINGDGFWETENMKVTLDVLLENGALTERADHVPFYIEMFEKILKSIEERKNGQ